MRVYDPIKVRLCFAVGILSAVLFALLLGRAEYLRYAAAAVLALAAVAFFVFVKKRSILSFNKRQVLLILSVLAVLFLTLLYISGLFYGFAIQYKALSLTTFFRFLLPYLVIIVASEVIRSVLLAQNSRAISVLLYVLCVLSDLTIGNGLSGISSMYGLMDFVGMTFFPALSANLLYHYVSKRYGMLPNVVFRSLLRLYPYVIPRIPNAPQILVSFVTLLIPLIAYAFLDALYKKGKGAARQKRSRWSYIGGGVGIALLVGFIMLISCSFRFGMLVIATDSMTGEINRGDAIVYEAVSEAPKENDVIVFQKEGEAGRVVHRVIGIETVDGETRYYTKGDANPERDTGFITSGEILGVVRFKVLYIGYPSLWLRDIFH